MPTNNSINTGKPIEVSNGGTGAATFTSNGLVYGATTSPLAVTGAGTTGQVLIATTSNPPSWGAVPTKPYFFVYLSNTVGGVTGDNTNYTVKYNTVYQDSAGGYNGATGQYTVPATGIWVFGYTLLTYGFAAQTVLLSFLVNSTSWRYYGSTFNPTNVGNSIGASVTGTVMSQFNSGALISTQLQVNGAAKGVNIYGLADAGGDQASYFWGYQIA